MYMGCHTLLRDPHIICVYLINRTVHDGSLHLGHLSQSVPSTSLSKECSITSVLINSLINHLWLPSPTWAPWKYKIYGSTQECGICGEKHFTLSECLLMVVQTAESFLVSYGQLKCFVYWYLLREYLDHSHF